MTSSEIYKILALCNDPLPLASSGRAYANWIEAVAVVNQFFFKSGFITPTKEGPKRFKQ